MTGLSGDVFTDEYSVTYEYPAEQIYPLKIVVDGVESRRWTTYDVWTAALIPNSGKSYSTGDICEACWLQFGAIHGKDYADRYHWLPACAGKAKSDEGR